MSSITDVTSVETLSKTDQRLVFLTYFEISEALILNMPLNVAPMNMSRKKDEKSNRHFLTK